MGSRKGSKKGVLVQEGGGFSAGRGLGRISWGSLWARWGGGVLVQKKGGVPVCFLYTSRMLSVPILPTHLLVGFCLHTMQKAVATFVGSVHRVTPNLELDSDAQRHRRKLLQLVVGAVLEDAAIIVHSDNNFNHDRI